LSYGIHPNGFVLFVKSNVNIFFDSGKTFVAKTKCPTIFNHLVDGGLISTIDLIIKFGPFLGCHKILVTK
jgi:hypothetical protein